jgi:hypothetical protein
MKTAEQIRDGVECGDVEPETKFYTLKEMIQAFDKGKNDYSEIQFRTELGKKVQNGNE